MSTPDSPPSLYEAREPIFPRRVKGTFRTLKWWIMAVTLGIYYITPWLRWDRGPSLPDQAVLVDIANRRFFFFMLEIWPHEFYFVAGLLIMAGLGLFLFTSAARRVWCGYACPQTVWTDLFILVERWIEGDRNARVRLYKQKWDAEKIRKRAIKWTVWFLIGLATGGAWIFYFADAPSLMRSFLKGDAPLVAYSTVAILTATTYVFGGLMREQVCIYMCPWPRIQTAMLDEKSLIVTYKDWRGEPRTHGVKKAADQGIKTGDCIDCTQCVQVCPTGIDIREGPQIGCITCALCIDACDGVMEKVGLPKGLISYSTLKTYDAHKAGGLAVIGWRAFLRPRTFVYSAIWLAVGLAMFYSLLHRERLEVNVLNDRNPIYVRLSDGSIRNGFTVKILNMEQRPRSFAVSAVGLPGGTMTMTGGDGEALREFTVDVEADTLRAITIYVAVSPLLLGAGRTILGAVGGLSLIHISEPTRPY